MYNAIYLPLLSKRGIIQIPLIKMHHNIKNCDIVKEKLTVHLNTKARYR